MPFVRPPGFCRGNANLLETRENGGTGIRTQEALARPTVFKTAPFDRSGTPPVPRLPRHTPARYRATVSGAPNGFSASGTSPRKFSRIASTQRSVTAVPFNVWTTSVPF